MGSEVKIVFQPSGKSVSVSKGQTILEAAQKCGLEINNPCGSSGTCGKCRVVVSSGNAPAEIAHEAFFTPAEIAHGWRLACKTIPQTDITVEVPQSSLISSKQQI